MQMVPTNYPTRYEIVLTNGTVSHFLRFSTRVTKISLYHTMREFGPKIIELASVSETDEITWDAKAQAFVITNGYAIRRSGRTERDIKNVAA